MTRYTTRRPAKSYIQHSDCGPVFLPYLTVDSDGPTETGLVDQYGNDICRMNDPIGFQF